MNQIEMRLTGTQEDLQVWLDLIRKMEKHRVVEVLQVSDPYKNWGESKLYRAYLKLNLKYSPVDDVRSPQTTTEAAPTPSSRKRRLKSG